MRGSRIQMGSLLFRVFWLSMLAVLISRGFSGSEIYAGIGETGMVQVEEERFVTNASPKIDVRTFNGSIYIHVGSDGIVLVQTTLRGASRIEYDAVQDAETIRVRANLRLPPSEFNAKTMINLTVPLGSDVELFTGNGRISVDGLHGTVDLETGQGTVEFTGAFPSGSTNKIRTHNGGVVIHLMSEGGVYIDASATGGSVRSTLPVIVELAERNHLVGTIGLGQANLFVRSTNGSVLLWKCNVPSA